MVCCINLPGTVVPAENINYFDIDQLKELEKFLSIDDDTLYKFYNNQIETIENIDNDFIRYQMS